MKHFCLMLCFVCSWLPVALQAQPIDTVQIRAYYIATFKDYTDQKYFDTEEKELLVGKRHTAFFGRWHHQRELIMDSISRINGSYDDLAKALDPYPRPRAFYGVYQQYPRQGRRMVTDAVYGTFYYEEDIAPIAWNIESRDTTILDTPCQFATCGYGGRQWTVCFAPSIPVQAGPWKLHGLPGLIVYAQDSTKIFTFECIEIKAGGDAMQAPSLRKRIKCTRQELNQFYTESAHSPEEYVRNRFGIPNNHIGPDGKPLVSRKREPEFLEK